MKVHRRARFSNRQARAKLIVAILPISQVGRFDSLQKYGYPQCNSCLLSTSGAYDLKSIADTGRCEYCRTEQEVKNVAY